MTNNINRNRIRAALLASLCTIALCCTAAPQSSAPTIESGFSPDGSAINLVLKAKHSAKTSIRLAAYAFTNPDVVRALIEAKRRGVDVAVVVDAKENLSGNGASIRSISALVDAGVPVRTISIYPIMHNKYRIIDGTASFDHLVQGSGNAAFLA